MWFSVLHWRNLFAAIVLAIVMISVAFGQINGEVPVELRQQVEQLAGRGQYGKAFNLYQNVFGKNYSSPGEVARRRELFRRNFNFVKEHNDLFSNGSYAYQLAVNFFADMTSDEIVANYTGFNPNDTWTVKDFKKQSVREATRYYEAQGGVPDNVDLRLWNLVTPVVSQLTCGGCWAFSSVAALETAAALRTGCLVPLSPQNLLDCARTPNISPCVGGSMRRAYYFTEVNLGLASAKQYPYIGAAGDTCQNHGRTNGTRVTSYKIIRTEADMKDAVGRGIAVSVAINASPLTFAYYDKGIYSDPTCSPDGLTHAVTVVGYGTDNGIDYWILKNSWGIHWGLQGYMRMARGINMCGIATEMTFPVVVASQSQQ